MTSAVGHVSRNTALPSWRRVLAVVAHPDDESFGLGAVLAAFAAVGSEVSVLCLTRGEASTVQGVEGDLAQVRAQELQRAGQVLGLTRVGLREYPDGALADVPLDDLRAEIAAFAGSSPPDGIVVFDPSGITGHDDHQRATEAALGYARTGSIPVLGWTLPDDVAATLNTETGAGFSGHPQAEVDLVIDVDRSTQELAVACHPSQAVPGSVLWRRLDLLGPREHLRWLHHPDTTNDAGHSSKNPSQEGSTP